MPLVTENILDDQASRPLPDLEAAARRALRAVKGLFDLRLQGPAGTDITVALDGAAWQSDALPLTAGAFANFPYGEIFTLPTSANGVVVADLTIPFVSSVMLEEPVSIQFVDGEVSAISGGREAVELERLLREAGTGAAGVAEVGLGLNAELTPCGHVLIDEKVAGTAHVAIGGNAHMGGTRIAPVHIDCVFTVTSLSSGGELVELG